MGYKSDVLIAFGVPDKDELMALFAAAKLMPWYDKGAPNKWNKEGEIGNYKYTEVVYDKYERVQDSYNVTKGCPYYIAFAKFEDVKWYESYDDVEWHEALFKLAQERGLETLFVRIGEEYHDVMHEHYEGDNQVHVIPNYMHLQRTITQDVETTTPILEFLGNKKENNNAPE